MISLDAGGRRRSTTLGFVLASCRSRKDALIGPPTYQTDIPRAGGVVASSASLGIPIAITTTAAVLLERFEAHVEGSMPDELAKDRLINHPVARNRLAVWPPMQSLSIVLPSMTAPSVDASGKEVTAPPLFSAVAHNAGGITVQDVVDAIVQACAGNVPP